MATSHQAGELIHRVTLQHRASDANGDPLGDWETVFQRRVKLVNLRGGEGVMQQRIQGNQPVLLVVRACSETRSVDNSFRAINHQSRQIYDLSAATETPDRAWVEILGVAKSGDLHPTILEG